jgi:hypothetical protein
MIFRRFNRTSKQKNPKLFFHNKSSILTKFVFDKDIYELCLYKLRTCFVSFLIDNILHIIYDVVHLKTNIYLKIFDRPSRISTKHFLNFFKLFLGTL